MTPQKDFTIHSRQSSEKETLTKKSPSVPKNSSKSSIQKNLVGTRASDTIERTILKNVTPSHELQLFPNSQESTKSDEESSIPSSPSEEMKNRRMHDAIFTNFNLPVDDLVSTGVASLPTPLKVGQFTPVKVNPKQQNIQDVVMAQSAKFRKDLIKTPLPKSQLFKVENRLVSPLQTLQEIENGSSTSNITPKSPKLISLESKSTISSGIKLEYRTPNEPSELNSSRSPSVISIPIELSEADPASNVKKAKLATPLIKEIDQGLKLKSKLKDLKRLSTPLKREIEDGIFLREPKKSKSLPIALKGAIEAGVELKKSRNLKALTGSLKQAIENGVSLKATKKFPKLKTPLKRAIEQPTKLKPIRPIHKLVTPLKKAIELGHPLNRINVYKKLMTPLKKEIEHNAKRRSLIRQHPILPVDLDEAIKKGAAFLKKSRGFQVLDTPLREDIKKGVALKKLKNTPHWLLLFVPRFKQV